MTLLTIPIDDKLLDEVVALGHFSSKKEAVNVALSDWLQKYRAKELTNMFGTVEYDEHYDYKAERQRDNEGIDE